MPSAGIVTQWYFQDGSAAVANLKLKVGRDEGAPSFLVVGDSPAGTQTVNQISGPYPVNIPVKANDIIGIFNADSTGKCALSPAGSLSTFVFEAGDQLAGTTSTFSTPASGLQFPVEAFVEADVDNDGFGDLTQDKCPGVAAAQQGCLKADLSITKTAGAGSVTVGQNVAYMLTARNNGPSPAPQVVVSDALPPGASLVSATPSAGTCTGASPVRCDVGTLASGAGATVQVVVTMTSAGAKTDTATVDSATLDQEAQAASGAGDTNAANNSASVTTRVNAGPVTAAVVSHATQTHARWREPKKPKAAQISRKKRAPIGTTFRFTLDKPAAVRLAFTQAVSGRRVGSRCVAPTRANRKRRRCTRTLTRGTISLSGHSGVNTIRFQGRVSRTRRLRLGSHRLVITASTPGAGSTSKTLRFTIVR